MKVILAVIVLLWVIHKVQVHTIVQSIQNPRSPVFIGLAMIMLIPNIGLQWIRWHFLLRLIDPGIRFRESFTSLLGGITVGLITPGRIGEFGRALFLHHMNYVKALGLIFIDKFYASIVLIIFGIWGVISFLGFQMGPNIFLLAPLIGLGLLASAFGIILMFRPRYMRTFFYNLTLLLPFREKMKLFIDGLDHFDENKAKPFIIYSVLLYFIYILQFSLLALAFEKIPVHVLLTSTTSTMFTKIVLPFSIGDLGIREGAAVYFFKSYAVSKTTAFNSAFLLFCINLMIPAITGLFFIPQIGWRENGHPKKR